MSSETPEYVTSTDHTVGDDGEVKIDLYNANHGKAPRTGGPYRDDIEMEQAELVRARFENREPDFDNPPASAGTVLVPKSLLVERDTDKSHFSDRVPVENEPVGFFVADTSDPFKGEPDPTQPNWDNDMSKVAALDAGLKMEELKAKAQEQGKTDNPEPKDEDFNVEDSDV